MSDRELEPELNQPTPRRVRLREGLGAGRALWFPRLFILPHAVVGVGFLVGAIWQTLLYLGVLIFGANVDARVVAKNEEGSNKGSSYYVRYTYTVEDREFTRRIKIDQEKYSATQVGDAIPVRTLPWTDKGHWLRDADTEPIGRVLSWWAVAVFWNAFLFLFLRSAYLLPWRQRQLVRWGQPVQGIVRSVERWEYKGTNVRVTYDYAVSPGGVFKNSMKAAVPEAKTIQVGDVVTVLYMPTRPRRSLVYSLVGYKSVPDRQ